MIEADLTTFLKAAMGHSRVYPLVIPQGTTLPALAYQTISDPSELDSGGVVDLVDGRFQITAVAESYKAAKIAARTVKDALDGYRGAMGASTVQAARLDGTHEEHEPETGRFTVAQDFIISFKE
jgi:hypothetical protein